MMVVLVVVYGPPNCAIAVETALPKLKFAACWLHDAKLYVPAVQVPVWLLLWLIDELPVAEMVFGTPGIGSPAACAADTALPLLKFEASWLHEKALYVPALQLAL